MQTDAEESITTDEHLAAADTTHADADKVDTGIDAGGKLKHQHDGSFADSKWLQHAAENAFALILGRDRQLLRDDNGIHGMLTTIQNTHGVSGKGSYKKGI